MSKWKIIKIVCIGLTGIISFYCFAELNKSEDLNGFCNREISEYPSIFSIWFILQFFTIVSTIALKIYSYTKSSEDVLKSKALKWYSSLKIISIIGSILFIITLVTSLIYSTPEFSRTAHCLEQPKTEIK
ncbi:MAG: magnesium-transporting ATPase (P-type) [Bacteriovoracaceae bacterium]|jgi:magnesium-transporting ATPase (P-type)